MDLKKWLTATVGAFVVIFVSEFFIHQVWLSEFYRAHAQWWRPASEMRALMHLMLLGQLLFASLLALVYTKGYEKKKQGIEQGVRFGLLMGALLLAPSTLMCHCIYPYPASLLLSWLVGGMVEMILVGAVIGALYQPAK